MCNHFLSNLILAAYVQIIQCNLNFYFFESIVLVSSNFLPHFFCAIIKTYLIGCIYNF